MYIFPIACGRLPTAYTYKYIRQRAFRSSRRVCVCAYANGLTHVCPLRSKFTRKNTYYIRKFDIIDPNKQLI